MKYKIILLNVFIAVIIVCSCNKNNLNQPALGLLDDAALANKNGVRGFIDRGLCIIRWCKCGWVQRQVVLAAIIRGLPIGSMEVFAEAKRTKVRRQLISLRLQKLKLFMQPEQ